MTVVSTKNKSKAQEVTYPMLKIARETYAAGYGQIVLFTGPTTGTVVHCGTSEPFPLGHHSDRWHDDPDTFSPYIGSIKLSNDV